MSLAPQFGSEDTIKALGRTWKVARLDKSIWDEMLAWAEPRIRNPLIELKPLVNDLPPQVSLQLIRECLNECPSVVTLHHPRFQEACKTPEGMIHQLWLQLKVHQPDVTEQQAWDILVEIGEMEMNKVTDKTSGKPPPRKKKSVDGWSQHPANNPAGLRSLAIDSSVLNVEVPPEALGHQPANSL